MQRRYSNIAEGIYIWNLKGDTPLNWAFKSKSGKKMAIYFLIMTAFDVQNLTNTINGPQGIS